MSQAKVNRQQELFDLNGPSLPPDPEASEPQERFRLLITLDYAENNIRLIWKLLANDQVRAALAIECTSRNQLSWHFHEEDPAEDFYTSYHRNVVRARLNRLKRRYPLATGQVSAQIVVNSLDRDGKPTGQTSVVYPDPPPDPKNPWRWIEDEIVAMAEEEFDQIPADVWSFFAQNLKNQAAWENRTEQLRRQNREKAERQARVQERLRQQQDERRRKQQQKQRQKKKRKQKQNLQDTPAEPRPASAPPPPKSPIPQVPVRIELPSLQFQDGFIPLPDLQSYFLREQAEQWWVSNQADDLLCLPYCRLEHLEYQLRTALRVMGPLRGRALLSDEVGLGKTIEAGLVLKEYLTRGMAKRYLVLTVPSLVDQWADELSDKFQLTPATTNQPVFRSNPQSFWQENPGIVASLHTLKQPAHLAVAQQVHWDILIVDEAHYLRNRTSQAWQAISALPRQFLLLLTATPVQNSLEELYNLVTLLQPGQLPSPKEFRDRFIQKNRPHEPREPEELRRLLNQVMIRNTRSNAGIELPPRRAETVQFEPEDAEREFWNQWEAELRDQLARLKPSQASLWGRLLLQTAGSSPAAWRETLKSFPEQSVAQAWSQKAPLEPSWQKKCRLLPPIISGEGGAVIFTQFRHTQAALAEWLQSRQISAWVIHGQTPAAERQPITEQFREHGGALLLTHSGTEGRNLQFCHRLVNFDLPWNPMEIEQRIGRLHRLGQQHPVRIYNLVQSHTLQDHLLQILQDKLNLFELVVGEAGLILGERFSSDEFAEEVFRRWQASEGQVAEAMQALGEELANAHQSYSQVKQLDETLFSEDYETQ